MCYSKIPEGIFPLHQKPWLLKGAAKIGIFLQNQCFLPEFLSIGILLVDNPLRASAVIKSRMLPRHHFTSPVTLFHSSLL